MQRSSISPSFLSASLSPIDFRERRRTFFFPPPSCVLWNACLCLSYFLSLRDGILKVLVSLHFLFDRSRIRKKICSFNILAPRRQIARTPEVILLNFGLGNHCWPGKEEENAGFFKEGRRSWLANYSFPETISRRRRSNKKIEMQEAKRNHLLERLLLARSPSKKLKKAREGGVGGNLFSSFSPFFILRL